MANTPISKMPQQQQGEDNNQFTTIDVDNVMMKEILTTHVDHNCHKVDVKPHLQLIEEIIQCSTTLERSNIHDLQVYSHMKRLNEKVQKVDFICMLEALVYIIHNISCEISCNCIVGGDMHKTTVSLFKSLSKFSWDAKLVYALAAFTVTYGEFWLVVELCGTHPLANSIALLKQLPLIFVQSKEKLKPRFEALWCLIKAILNMTKCIVQFHKLPHQYISPDRPPMSVATTHIPTAAYWTIRSIVACTSQVIGHIDLDHGSIPSTTKTEELWNLAQKVNNIHDHLTKQLNLCNKHIEEKKQVEAYTTLVQLFEMIHTDNMAILKALICDEDGDSLPLFDRKNNRRVGIEVLRDRRVFLLISDLDISQEEFVIMKQIIRFDDVVWLPVVDKSLPWTKATQRDFDQLQSNLRCYSVHHPSLIHPEVIKYIKEVWHFKKKPIIVFLDEHGRVLECFGVHLLWIWGHHVFLKWVEKLRGTYTWKLGLLVELGFEDLDGGDENILGWIHEERFICLYGGEDIDWIRKFTKTTREVAQAAGISLEMVYMGKRNPNKERLRSNIDIITTEKLSYCWEDLTLIWYFWTRVESIWHETTQLGGTIENNPVLKGVSTMLMLDGNEDEGGGWALLSEGSDIMAKAVKGDIILNCFKEYDKWKENVKVKGFMDALSDHLEQLQSPHHCNHFILPEFDGMIPEMVVCTECGRRMEKSITYRCCND